MVASTFSANLSLARPADYLWPLYFNIGAGGGCTDRFNKNQVDKLSNNEEKDENLSTPDIHAVWTRVMV